MLGRRDLGRTLLATGAAAAALAPGARVGAQPAPGAVAVPQGYPSDYMDLVNRARQEGRVQVYTSTDAAQAQNLLDAFKAAHPQITVDWNDMNTNAAFSRVVAEAAAKQVGADLVWTSAMDQLLSLVDRNLTQPYKSPEAASLPGWAVYKEQGYGTTVEPAAVLYNKTLLPEAQVPKTHGELLALLRDRKDALRNKVGSFDPEKSGTGFLFATSLQRGVPQFWDLVKAFGAVGGKVYSSSGQMKEKAASGEHAILFNVIGSYAMEWVKTTPNLGMVFLSDYVPAFSRVAVLPKDSPHPNAGKLFLDFMLSSAGQHLMGERNVPSVRTDADGPMSLAGLQKAVGGNLHPIPVDASTAANLETKHRVEFLQQWRRAMQG